MAWDYATEVNADSPYLFWRTDESAGPTAADSSGNGRAGTYFGTDITFEQAGVHSDRDARLVRFNPSGTTYDAGILYTPVAAGFPSTDFTLEWVGYDFTAGAGRTLWSYSDGTDHDFIRVVWSNFSNQVDVTIDGNTVALNMVSPFGRSQASLQHYAITWQNSDGEIRLYVNGALMEANNVSSGSTITGGGGLVVMQDQDSQGGTFQTADALRGTVGEFAVYDSVLSWARLRAHASAAITNYVTVNEIPFDQDVNGGALVSNYLAGDEITQYVNRVWDTVKGSHHRWVTFGVPDPSGSKYDGPGTYGVNTSAWVLEARR